MSRQMFMRTVTEGTQERTCELFRAVGVLDDLGGEVASGIEQRRGGVVPMLMSRVEALCDGVARFIVDASFKCGR